MTVVDTPIVDPGDESNTPSGEPTVDTTAEEHAANTGLTLEQAQEELKKVRNEAAGRRVALKPYEEAFDGWPEDARNEFLSIAKQLSDPETQPAVAKRLQQMGQQILDAQDPKAITPIGEVDPESLPVTRKELREREEARQREREEAEGIAGVERWAEKLGYAPIVNDAKGQPTANPEYLMLLNFASEPGIDGDLDKAAARFSEWQDSIVAKKAQAKGAQAAKWPGGGPDIPSQPAADADGGSPKTYREATRALRALLDAKPGE